MRMRQALVGVALIVIAAVGVTGCGAKSPATPKAAAGAVDRPAVAVTVVAAATSEAAETVDVVGSLAPKFSADVKSEVSGTVAEVYVTEWVAVRKGAPLARLDASESEAAIESLRAAEAQARVGAVRAKREHERAVELKQYGLITAQALDEARSALDAADAGQAAAAGQVRAAAARLDKSFIRAPMDGVVAERAVSVGDRVENMGSGRPMFRIVDNRLLDLTAAVPTGRLPALGVGQRLEFVTDALPGRTFSGRLTFINPSVDEASRSVKVGATVVNSDGVLKGGLFIRGRIFLRARADVLQVPREALLDWNVADRTATLFVVCDDRAEKRTVRTGAVTAQSVEISGGLTAGEQIVTRGAFALRSGDRVVVAAASGA